MVIGNPIAHLTVRRSETARGVKGGPTRKSFSITSVHSDINEHRRY
jgi:hypothetical protein